MKWKERWKFFAIKWWHQRFTNPLPCFVIHMVSNKETQTFKQTFSNDVLTSGVSITCVCDPQGAIFNCFPTNYKRRGEVTASSREASVRRAEVDTDERVEIILATTALVAVIAMFLRCKTPDPCCCMSLTFGGWASYPLIFRSMHMSVVKLQLNSQLPTPDSQLRVELELYLIIGLYHHHPPYYLSDLQNQVN